jgi:hypothetical protein
MDGDGVCDLADRCPTTFDPGQADPDGDGIGWACDPVESIAIQAQNNLIITSHGTASAFAAQVFDGCSSVAAGCQYEVAAVSSRGMITSRTDSGLTQDAWLAAAKVDGGLIGPLVSADDRVFLSSGTGDTVDVDLAAQSYNHVFDGVLDPRSYESTLQIPQLVGLTSTTGTGGGTSLARPQGPGLVSLGTGYGEPAFTYTTGSLVGVVTRTGSTYGVASFDSSTGALISMAQNLTSVRSMVTPTLRAEALFCGVSGGQTSLYVVSAVGPTVVPLGFSTCPFAPMPSTETLETVYLGGADAAGRFLVYFWRDGVLKPLFDETAPGVFEVHGKALQVVTYKPDTTTTKVWIVTATGVVVPVPHSLANVSVSVYGDTVHIVGVRPGMSIGGTVVLIRYREATGIQETDVGPAPFSSDQPVVITTHEGAALVDNDDSMQWAVPSASMTPVQLNVGSFKKIDGAVRGTATVVFTDSAVFAYDELAGPRVSRLTPDVQNTFVRVFDAPYQTTEWFGYQDGTHQLLARIRYAANTPAVETFVVSNANDVVISGERIGGDLIAVVGSNDVYTLASGGAVRVAHFTDQSNSDRVVRDYSTSPQKIIGWHGTDATGGVACLATHPERCWAVDASSNYLPTTLYADSSGDGMFSLESVAIAGQQWTLQIVRAIGPGNHPQPL